MSKPRKLNEHRARSVVVWAVMCYAMTQLIVFCLPGYPWPARTDPEVAVRANRFNRNGAWLRNVPTLEESIIQWQVCHLLTAVGPQDIVFIGDSSCLMGVVPQVISEATKMRTWNLGTVGSLSTTGHAEILNLYLRKHERSKPKLVVCYLASPTLKRTQEETENLGVLNGFREWLHGKDAGRMAQEPLAQLPGYRLRSPLSVLAKQMLGAQPPATDFDVSRGKLPSDDEIRQTLLETHGYLAEPRSGPLSPAESQYHNLAMSPDGLRGIIQMFEMADSMSINLVLIINPQPELYRDGQAEVGLQRIEQALIRAARPFSRVTVHAPALRWFDNDDFGTPQHLTKLGAIKNSIEVARILNGILSSRGSSSIAPHRASKTPSLMRAKGAHDSFDS